MKKDLTEIIVILDRSGSMLSIRDDAIGGFNAFIQAQCEIEGEANVSLVQFDDYYEEVYLSKPVKEVTLLDTTTYVPRGATALLDAIGRAVYDIDTKIATQDESERPGKVIVAILTDGAENASREYKKEHILKIIKTQEEKQNWEFIYLSADANAMSDALSYGIKVDNLFIFNNDKKGTKTAFTNMTTSVTNFRNTGFIK